MGFHTARRLGKSGRFTNEKASPASNAARAFAELTTVADQLIGVPDASGDESSVMPPRSFQFLLQIPQNKIRHHLLHVLDQDRINYAVARLGVEHELNLLPCLL